eukprot:gene5168-18391_t
MPSGAVFSLSSSAGNVTVIVFNDTAAMAMIPSGIIDTMRCFCSHPHPSICWVARQALAAWQRRVLKAVQALAGVMSPLALALQPLPDPSIDLVQPLSSDPTLVQQRNMGPVGPSASQATDSAVAHSNPESGKCPGRLRLGLDEDRPLANQSLRLVVSTLPQRQPSTIMEGIEGPEGSPPAVLDVRKSAKATGSTLPQRPPSTIIAGIAGTEGYPGGYPPAVSDVRKSAKATGSARSEPEVTKEPSSSALLDVGEARLYASSSSGGLSGFFEGGDTLGGGARHPGRGAAGGHDTLAGGDTLGGGPQTNRGQHAGSSNGGGGVLLDVSGDLTSGFAFDQGNPICAVTANIFDASGLPGSRASTRNPQAKLSANVMNLGGTKSGQVRGLDLGEPTTGTLPTLYMSK